MSDTSAEIPEDLHQHLNTFNRAFFVSHRADGSPTCHPMGSFYADRELYFNMYASSAKHRNLLRDPRTTVLVTNPSDSHNLEVAVLRGSARLLPGDEILALDAPAGVVKARGIGMEGVKSIQDAPEKFAREDPEDLMKRAAVMVERIRDGIRVLWQIVPDSVAWLRDVRE